MSGSGLGLRGVRLSLLALLCGASPLAAAPQEAAASRTELAQAAPAPTIVAPRPPASIVQPQPRPPAAPPAAAVSSPAAALPFSLTQNAGGYTASNLRFALGPTAYLIPSAEIRGTKLSRDELASLLDPATTVPLAERVGRLAAAEIVIPELRAETTLGATRQSAVYRDIRISEAGAGRIASASAGGGSFEGSTPEGPSRGTFARMDLSEIDLGLMVALLDPQPNAASAELRRIYGAFSIEGIATEGPKAARSRIARMAGRDFRARPTRDGWIATANAFSGHTDLDKASPEERARVVGALVDLFEAFEVGSLEATGIEFSDASGKDAAGRVSRIAYEGGSRGGEFRVEGFEAGGEDGRVRIASFSIGGISLAPMLAAARELSGKAELAPAEMRRLVPIIGSVRLTGIEVDTKGYPKTREAPMQVSVGVLEFLADKPVEGIPTDLRLNLRNLTVPIAGAGKEGKQLAALGYDKIEASLAANLGWNQAGEELVIRELSVQGTGMGSLGVRGVVGNISKDAFSPDQALAAVAWMGATARSLDIALHNNGLFERILAQQAAEKKRSPDDLRREYGMAAAVGIPVMLGNSPAAKALGQAVARFVAKPGRLTIEVRARDPGGLGVVDFMAAADPTALLEKVEINAAAE